MKHLFLLLFVSVLSVSAIASTSPPLKKITVSNLDHEIFSRQCCTVTVFQMTNEGACYSIEITACAGWFLSNDEAAYDRACTKAAEAALGILNND